LDPFLKTLDLISPGLLNGLISEGLVDGFESFEIRLAVPPDCVVRLRLDVGIGGGAIVAAGSSTTPWFADTLIGKDRAVGVGDVSCISQKLGMWHDSSRSHFGSNTVAKHPLAR
jgi:hypothetical protein